jgi:hypothetical protein
MTRFRKKTIEIDAMRWTGYNIDELMQWAGPQVVNYPTDKTPENLLLTTIDDVEVPCPVGHWVIREPVGNRFYPCDPKVFAERYEPVDADGAFDTAPVTEEYLGEWIDGADGEGCIHVGCKRTGRHFHHGGIAAGNGR